jgi:hypothetical protein
MLLTDNMLFDNMLLLLIDNILSADNMLSDNWLSDDSMLLVDDVMR